MVIPWMMRPDFGLKFTTITHRSHVFCSPMNDGKAELLLEHLELDRAQRVVDIGCGKGELLIRMVEQFRIEGVGVDRSPTLLSIARERSRKAGISGRISFLEHDVGTYTADSTCFAAGLCIGSGAAFGFFADVAKRMSRLVQPGGLLLIGDCYWKQEPAEEYLQFLGIDRKVYSSHEGNLETARQLQLRPLWSTTSSDEEWDAYEELYRRNIEDYVAENPEDPDVPAMIEQVRTWNRMYHEHGRSTLGFGFYLLKVENAQPT
jgi:cyclopropane fatty-acyl-phospholipid synthase-like methyltransferase